MNKQESIKVLTVLKAAYPNSYKNITMEEANGVINLWTSQFKSVPGDIVMVAINKLISTNTFPPSIAEVRQKLGSMYYEALSEILSHDEIESNRLESLKRITNHCYNIDKEPELTSFIGCNKQEGLPNETYDKHKGNMSLLQA